MTISEAFPFLSNLLGEDQANVVHIVNITIEGLEASMIELDEAAELKDRVLAKNTLHRMRSSLGHMSLNQALEVMPRSGDEDMWDRLPTFTQTLEKELKIQKDLLLAVSN